MIQRASVDEMVTAFLNERQATTEEMALVSNALAAYSFIAGKNRFSTLLYTNSLKLYSVLKKFSITNLSSNSWTKYNLVNNHKITTPHSFLRWWFRFVYISSALFSFTLALFALHGKFKKIYILCNILDVCFLYNLNLLYIFFKLLSSFYWK